jgi:hypothetical protein
VPSSGVVAVDGSLLQVLDEYGFEPDDTRTRWQFKGHPSQSCTIDLVVEDTAEGAVYSLGIQWWYGGEGYEEYLRYDASQRPALERYIEQLCEEAREPYIKTRLQKLFEPSLGHDLAWMLFHRRTKKL